jgi:predicted ATPase with chaperone activity
VYGLGVEKRYVSKISKPLLDRIDLHVDLKDIHCNTPMSSRMAKEVCQLTSSGLTLLKINNA